MITSTIPDILARIVAAKQETLPALRTRRAELERAAEATRPGRRSFAAALRQSPPAIISEVKKASPSRGVLAEEFRPVETGRAYEAAGAAAISVLTDGPFFQGSLADLEAVRGAVRIPVLRKDFTIDELHVLEAAAHGADAILLIAAILDVGQMRRWRELATSLGMATLVEVHTGEELEAVIDSGAEIIGVNNRDLHTFQVSLDVSLELAAKIPAGATRVAESGIHGAADVARLRAAGYHAFLVGEHLMKSVDARAALEALRQ